MKDRSKQFQVYGKRPSYSIKERSIRYTLRSLAYITILVTVSIIGILLFDSITFFSKVNFFDFLFGLSWEPFGEPKKLGVLPLISGTLKVAIGSSLIAMPLGVGTAIFLTQFASDKTRDILQPIIEILGGIPSVVYGYFALVAVTPFLKIFFPNIGTFNALSASIVVGISIVPMIASISADSLKQVPKNIQHAGYALGMRKIHVIIKIILPAAASGIIASFILGFSRAIGETMAVTLAAGATPNLNFDYLESIQTITAFIVQVSLGDTPVGSLEYYTIYALGLTLFAITLLFNLLATKISEKITEKY